jgi:nucleoid DNA-binding protein
MLIKRTKPKPKLNRTLRFPNANLDIIADAYLIYLSQDYEHQEIKDLIQYTGRVFRDLMSRGYNIKLSNLGEFQLKETAPKPFIDRKTGSPKLRRTNFVPSFSFSQVNRTKIKRELLNTLRNSKQAPLLHSVDLGDKSDLKMLLWGTGQLDKLSNLVKTQNTP